MHYAKNHSLFFTFFIRSRLWSIGDILNMVRLSYLAEIKQKEPPEYNKYPKGSKG